MNFLLLSFSLVFSQLCFSSPWSLEDRRRFDQLTPLGAALETNSFATFWGGFRRAVRWNVMKGAMVSLKFPELARPLPVYIQAEKKKKKLLLFIPGVFGKPDGRISPQVIEALEKQDVHLAVIPNLVAETYLLSRKFSRPASLDSERKFLGRIVDETLELVGTSFISEIHLVAESLGVFQALLLEREFASMTLLWPPLYLNRSLLRFDEMIQKSEKVLENCSNWWLLPIQLYDIRMRPIPTSLTRNDKNCLGAWVIARGFGQSIEKTSKAFFDDRGLSTRALPKTFSSFVAAVLPEFRPFLLKGDPDFSARYLLAKAKTPRTRIRILSSKDDFLNEVSEWDELHHDFPELKAATYLFNWGGHSGPLGVDFFLEEIFR